MEPPDDNRRWTSWGLSGIVALAIALALLAIVLVVVLVIYLPLIFESR